jgi:translation initiation factor 5B
MKSYVNIVPTSAHTGEGIPDLLYLASALPQNRMTERLKFSRDLKCTVLEVKVIPGLGTTVDVILVDGVLHVVRVCVCVSVCMHTCALANVLVLFYF